MATSLLRIKNPFIAENVYVENSLWLKQFLGKTLYDLSTLWPKTLFWRFEAKALMAKNLLPKRLNN